MDLFFAGADNIPAFATWRSPSPALTRYTIACVTCCSARRRCRNVFYAFVRPGTGRLYELTNDNYPDNVIACNMMKVHALLISFRREEEVKIMTRSGRTVLVVSDEPVTVFSTWATLFHAHHRILVTGKRDGLRKLGDATIDLAIIDVASQDNPSAVARQLQSAHPGMRVLYLSSCVDGEVVRCGILNEATGGLEKAGLIGSVEKALRPRIMTAGG